MREKFSFCIFKIKRKVPSFENIFDFMICYLSFERRERDIWNNEFLFSGFLCFIWNFYIWLFLFTFLSCTWPMPVLERLIPTSHNLIHEPNSGQHDSLPKDHLLRLCGSFKRTLEPEHRCINYRIYFYDLLLIGFVNNFDFRLCSGLF